MGAESLVMWQSPKAKITVGINDQSHLHVLEQSLWSVTVQGAAAQEPTSKALQEVWFCD